MNDGSISNSRLRVLLAAVAFLISLSLSNVAFVAHVSGQEATPVSDAPADQPVEAALLDAPANPDSLLAARFCMADDNLDQTFWSFETLNNVPIVGVPTSDGNVGAAYDCQIYSGILPYQVNISLVNADTGMVVAEMNTPMTYAIPIYDLVEGSYYLEESLNGTRTDVFEVSYQFTPMQDPVAGTDPNAFEDYWSVNFVATFNVSVGSVPTPPLIANSDHGRVDFHVTACVSNSASSHEQVGFVWQDPNIRDQSLLGSSRSVAGGSEECAIESQIENWGARGSLYFDRLDEDGNVVESFGPLTALVGLPGSWTWDEHSEGPLPAGMYSARFVWASGTEVSSAPFPVYGFQSGTTSYWNVQLSMRLYVAEVPDPTPTATVSPTEAVTPTSTPNETETPTATMMPTQSVTPTPSTTQTPGVTPTSTIVPTQVSPTTTPGGPATTTPQPHNPEPTPAVVSQLPKTGQGAGTQGDTTIFALAIIVAGVILAAAARTFRQSR